MELVEELGASRLLHGKLSGHDFTVNAPNGEVPLAENMHIAVAPHATDVFDAGTGRRL